MIKSWAFEFFFASQEIEKAIIGAGANPSEAACADYASRIIPYFDAYLDLWVSAERLGFHGLLLSEHHFGGGYSPSPNLLLPLVRRQNIRHNSRRKLAECGPRLGFDVRRRACGVASADVRWSVA